MIEFRTAGTKFRMHVLVVIVCALAVIMGMSAETGFLAAALFVHETAHVIAARACGVEIDHIDIMPFGGAAHVRGLYSESGGAIAVTAMAGPAANGLFLLTAAALGWWGIIGEDGAQKMVGINGALMAFNLLPALPLDGGRVLYAALRGAAGRKMAVDAGAVIAYIIAGVMAAGAAALAVWGRKINISLIIMAVFLTASAWDERKCAMEDGMAAALRGMCQERALPAKVRMVAVDADGALSAAAKYLGGREATVFVMIRGGRIAGFLGEGEAAERIMGETEINGGKG